MWKVKGIGKKKWLDAFNISSRWRVTLVSGLSDGRVRITLCRDFLHKSTHFHETWSAPASTFSRNPHIFNMIWSVLGDPEFFKGSQIVSRLFVQGLLFGYNLLFCVSWCLGKYQSPVVQCVPNAAKPNLPLPKLATSSFFVLAHSIYLKTDTLSIKQEREVITRADHTLKQLYLPTSLLASDSI